MKYFILPLSVAALLIPIAWIEYDVLRHTNGTIAYPLDNTFLHMAIAKNLAFEHIWGISKYSFVSASSSPLYTLLLATTFEVSGAHLIVPLLINIAAAILFVVVLHRWLIRQGLTALARSLIMLAVIFLTPLPLLVICGMEHTLQLLFCFLFICSFSEAADDSPDNAFPVKVYIYGLLMVTTRYESMSMIAMACLLLALRRQWWKASTLVFFSFLPVFLFGLFSMTKGSFFIPNPILLKSGIPPLAPESLSDFFFHVFWRKLFFVSQDYNLLTAQRLLLILPLIYMLFLDTVRQHSVYRKTLIVLMGAVLGHVIFAYPSPYPRYEGYLVGCSLVICCTLIVQHGREALANRIKGSEWLAYLLLLLLAAPVFFRSLAGFRLAGQSCIGVYDQQYQMAKFLRASYYRDRDRVASNSIGAASLYSDYERIVDLTGVANLAVLKSRRMHSWSPVFADSITQISNASVIILHNSSLSPYFDTSWNKIACWHSRDDSLSFYSIDSGGVARQLQKGLHEYQSHLPAEVTVRYY